MDESGIEIKQVTWQEASNQLRAIREQVFIQEQSVPEDLEWDDQDEVSVHFLALDQDNNPVATARILPDGKIGRMAVLPEWRNKGIGTKMLDTALEYCMKNNIEAYLDAQVRAIEFYRRAGFMETGDIFMDAGMPHKKMVKKAD